MVLSLGIKSPTVIVGLPLNNIKVLNRTNSLWMLFPPLGTDKVMFQFTVNWGAAADFPGLVMSCLVLVFLPSPKSLLPVINFPCFICYFMQKRFMSFALPFISTVHLLDVAFLFSFAVLLYRTSLAAAYLFLSRFL